MKITPKAGEEMLKYLAAYFNGIALGFLGFAGIRPLVEQDSVIWGYILMSVALHLCGQYLLSRMKGTS